MKAVRRRFVAELYRRNTEHDASKTDRLERFRSVEEPTAELLGILIRARNAQRILELGTSSGYSTIWLADASEATGGKVVSVDADPERTKLARKNLERVLLVDRVELRTEDAEFTLRNSPANAWDFIFLDAERPAYPGYLADLMRVLDERGLLAIDNVVSHAHELIDFTRAIEAERDLSQTVVPVGAGLRIAIRM